MVALLASAALVLAALVLWPRREEWTRRPGRRSAPQATLRERYAAGEVTGRQYRDALIDVLKDRYVRDEIDLGEYEARLGLLFREPAAPRPAPDAERG